MTYQEACEAIEKIGRFSVKNSNEHTRRALSYLGRPDKKFPSIHIAGTNGKGSVCSYLSMCMRKSGRRTALFISPHLVRINERMSVDGENISDEEFVSVYEETESACRRMEEENLPHPSYFEFLFLMAMVFFARKQVDIAVIETGLGGRLDATNALESPVLAVITSISFDHMQYLGNTISAIAGEKAGIIGEGVPCVYDAADAEAARVISERAREMKSPARALRPDDYRTFAYRPGSIDFCTSFRYDGADHFTVRSEAPYQVQNAALSVLALKALRDLYPGRYDDLTADLVGDALLETYWPARMEQIRPKVYLDGAHNEDGIARFLEAAGHISSGRPAVLVFAVVSDKDYGDMIGEIARSGIFSHIIITRINGSRQTDTDTLASLFSEDGASDMEVVPDVGRAYRRGRNLQGSGYLFICGSLYLAGEIEEIIHD